MKFMLCFISTILMVAMVCNGEPYEPMIPYSFGYSTADGMSRTESGHGDVVTGSYSYTDANGDIRQVKYIADSNGFRPEGDISVDRKTASAAAALAALAPKAPIPAAPVHQSWSHHSAPIIQQHAAPIPAPYRSFNSFEQQKFAPAPAAWNTYPASAPVAFGQPVSYQVETPTHKIWVKY